jgi:hypothetical protein
VAGDAEAGDRRGFVCAGCVGFDGCPTLRREREPGIQLAEALSRRAACAGRPIRAAGLFGGLRRGTRPGGTCPNRGCAPKKVLVAAAHSLHEIARAGVHCIKVVGPRLDWVALIDREKQLIRPIPDSIAHTLTERGIEVIREHATSFGPNTVRVGPTTVVANIEQPCLEV